MERMSGYIWDRPPLCHHPIPFLTQMISAERIMGYGQLESEAQLETAQAHKKPPPEWPEKGEIVLEDVSFSYASNLPLVLKFLCIHIKPSEKVQPLG